MEGRKRGDPVAWWFVTNNGVEKVVFHSYIESQIGDSRKINTEMIKEAFNAYSVYPLYPDTVILDTRKLKEKLAGLNPKMASEPKSVLWELYEAVVTLKRQNQHLKNQLEEK